MKKLPTRKKILLIAWKYVIAFQCVWRSYLIETIAKIFLMAIVTILVSDGFQFQPILPFHKGENRPTDNLTIFYTPSNIGLADNLTKALDNNSNFINVTIIPIKNSYLLEEECARRDHANPAYMRYAAIVFYEASRSKLNYSIRIPGRVDDQWLLVDKLIVHRPDWRQHYAKFLSIQSIIDSTYITILEGRKIEIPFPEAFGKNIGVGRVYKATLILKFVSFTGLFICVTLFRSIMFEKESGIKEYQDLLGLSKNLLWIGRFLDVLLKGFVTNILLTLAMTWGLQVQPFILWLYLFLYNIKAACYLFFWSCFFRKKMTALITMIIFWITTSQIGTAFLVYSKVDFSSTTKHAFAFFFPNVGLSVGFMDLINLERLHIPESDKKRYWYEFALTAVSTVSSAIFYFILTILVDPMWHPRRGFYWPKWLCFPRKRGRSAASRRWDVETAYSRIATQYAETSENCKMFEQPPSRFKAQVRIINVKKYIFTSRGEFPIIDDITVDFFANEVTFILGETGSGKSTMIHLLLGSSVPDSGELYFGHMNVNDHNDLNYIRAQIGWCPQNNIFLGCMTVKQLLVFAGKLRGLDRSRLDSELQFLLDALELNDVSHMIASTVPNTTARLVCFAFAVMGRPPVIILDEPTAGMDMPARRRLWNIVKRLRKNHVIIVASNHMDEVEEMADRILILKDGKMICWGTPQYLKEYFGTCFEVRVECDENHKTETIEDVFTHYINDVQLKSLGPGDIMCHVSRSNASQIPQMVRKLRQLGVEQIKVSVCGMEDLFLKATKSSVKTQTMVSKILQGRLDQTSDTTGVDEQPQPASCLAKFTALFAKECIEIRRSWPMYTLGIIVITFIISFIIVTCESILLPVDEPAKLMTLDKKGGVVMYENDGTKELEQTYRKLVREHQAKPKLVANAPEDLKETCDDSRLLCASILVGARLKWSEGAVLEPSTALYTHSSMDAAPISVNLLSNAVLRTLQGQNMSISTYAHPLPKIQPYVLADLLGNALWQDLMPMVLGLWMASFMRSAYDERTSGCYHAQMRAGASPLLLWTARFFSHIILHCALIFLLVFVVFVVSVRTYSCPSAIGALIFLWVMYGFGGIPFIYFLSKIFSKVGNIVLCLTAIMVTTTAIFYADVIFQDEGDTHVPYYGHIFPTFTASLAFRKLHEQIMKNSPCRLKRPIMCPISYRDGEMISERECMTERYYVQSLSEYLLIELATGVGYLSVVILLDTHVARHAWMWLMRWRKYLKTRISSACRRRPVAERRSPSVSSTWEERLPFDVHFPRGFVDSQVAEERAKAREAYAEMTSSAPAPAPAPSPSPAPAPAPAPPPDHPLSSAGPYALVATELVLPGAVADRRPALVPDERRAGFCVRAGESVALLGSDARSGSDVLLHVLAGHALPSAGDVAGVACRLRHDRRRYRSQMGFAGWHTGLMANLTVQEHLDLFCRLRGVKPNEFCDTWVEVLGLGPRLHQRTGSMTTGQRRALAVALAFVAEPSAVLLDQPALGMDPRSRRRLAAAFAALRALGHSVVLTTTMMEDVEALCHRGIVLEDGQVTVLGTPFHIRQVLRVGYVIAFLLKNKLQDIEVVKTAMRAHFHDSCVFHDTEKVRVRFRIYNPNLSCEDLLEIVERVCKKVQDVTLYSIQDISPLHLLA